MTRNTYRNERTRRGREGHEKTGKDWQGQAEQKDRTKEKIDRNNERQNEGKNDRTE